MKICFLFHGHLRTFRDNHSIRPMLLDRYPGGDVLIHTFPVRNFHGNKWHTDDGCAGDAVTSADMDYLSSWLPNIVATQVVAKNSGGEYLTPEQAPMGFRWARADACRFRQSYEALSGEKYDVVFLARYDLGFREPFTFPDVIEPNTMYGGYNTNQVARDCDGEVFVYGAPAAIDKVMIPAIPPGLEQIASSLGYHGERLATDARKLAGVDYKAHRIPHFLYRSGGGTMDVWQ